MKKYIAYFEEYVPGEEPYADWCPELVIREMECGDILTDTLYGVGDTEEEASIELIVLVNANAIRIQENIEALKRRGRMLGNMTGKILEHARGKGWGR